MGGTTTLILVVALKETMYTMAHKWAEAEIDAMSFFLVKLQHWLVLS
jgi:hypothetical protein